MGSESFEGCGGNYKYFVPDGTAKQAEGTEPGAVATSPSSFFTRSLPRAVLHLSVASFAGSIVFGGQYPALRFAAHGANTLPPAAQAG